MRITIDLTTEEFNALTTALQGHMKTDMSEKKLSPEEFKEMLGKSMMEGLEEYYAAELERQKITPDSEKATHDMPEDMQEQF